MKNTQLVVKLRNCYPAPRQPSTDAQDDFNLGPRNQHDDHHDLTRMTYSDNLTDPTQFSIVA